MNPSVVLLAEDDVGVQLYVSKLLEANGFTVLTANDGVSALEVSRSYRGTIDLVLSDVGMPRMDGFELVKNMIEERPGVKVLLMTGNPVSPELFLSRGLTVLMKPFTVADLQRSIEVALGASTPLQ